jgi:hypothetical protein
MSDSLTTTPELAQSRWLYQELRLALVFNGGVSLAVWMGGAAKEIDRFRRAFSSAPADAVRLAPYRELCDLLKTVVMTDVIAGASAGGINGAFLGYVVANGKSLECAGENAVRDLWQNLGSMKDLLAADGEIQSVLLTDKILFGGCAKVFDQFKNADVDLSPDVSNWVRLAITATDTHGYQVAAPVTASTDLEVSGVDHRLLFRFHRIIAPDQVLLGPDLVTAILEEIPDAAKDGWPFPKKPTRRNLHDPKDGTTGNGGVAALLARAARTTSSFPIAFYPSELPLNYTAKQKVADPEPGARLTATPAMAEILHAPNTATPLLPDGAPGDTLDLTTQYARYAIDGGVWDNSPFEAVLRAVEKSPSGRDVRRVLTYLVGTREPPLEAQKPEQQPPLLSSLKRSLATPSDLAFANDLARIRADCEQQHSHRNAVLRLLNSEKTDLFVLADQLFPVYNEKLRARAKDDVAGDDVEMKLVAAALMNLESLPAKNDNLDAWLATPETWGWGAEAVRATVQRARRMLRSLLRAAGAAELSVEDAEALITAREHLSQLAWVLDDITDHAEHAADVVPLRRICALAMADFATVVTGVQQITDKLLARKTAPLNDKLLAALRATKTVADGDTADVIRRALALHVALESLTEAPPDTVDYAFTAIRPSEQWPDPPPAGQEARPPLAGAALGHFGGFLRASWRLHDWMWGRIDGNQGLVNNLITREQLARLAPAADTRGKLAHDLAAFVIPNTDQAEMLAKVALKDAATPAPSGERGTFQRDPAVAALTAEYEKALDAIMSTEGDEATLMKLRGDVGRRFRYTIVCDEISDLVKACNAEGGPPRDAESLIKDPAAALLALASDTLCEAPNTGELALDGEHALANALEALNHKTLSGFVRGAAGATNVVEKAAHAAKAVEHYIGRFHPHLPGHDTRDG